MNHIPQALLQKYPGATSFRFGDSEALCARLTDLVRHGKKTATCGYPSDFSQDNETPPLAGRCDIAMHWDLRPALVLRTLSVTEVRFCDVTEIMALKEGENNSLADWRRDHEAYFTRNGGFSFEMPLLFEEFEVVEILD